MQIQKGHLHHRLNPRHKAYKLSFEVMPLNTVDGNVSNIIHLAPAGTKKMVPAVLMQDGSTKIQVSNIINGTVVNYISDQELPMNTYSSVILIQQQHLDGVYRFSVYINDVKSFQVINVNPLEWDDVEVYISSPWFDAAPVVVKDFRYQRLPESGKSCLE